MPNSIDVKKGATMTLRKIIGAVMLCLPFAAIAITYSVGSGHWWLGPLVLLAGFSLTAFVGVAVWLMVGGDK